jgi:hypothetical protein
MLTKFKFALVAAIVLGAVAPSFAMNNAPRSTGQTIQSSRAWDAVRQHDAVQLP